VSTRHFLADDDLGPEEQMRILDLAGQMKAGRYSVRPLVGPRTVAVLFDKASTRTRVSFAVAIVELGGYPLVLDTSTMQLGRGESPEDTARVLDRQCAAIVWRTYGQDRLEAMASVSQVPVVNALSDRYHPCQVLADLLTVQEHVGHLAGRSLAYLGDAANNMSHSYLIGGTTAGMHVRVAGPSAHLPDPAVIARATEIAERTGGSVTVTQDPWEAVAKADVLATDTWVSMGQEAEYENRLRIFSDYRIDQARLAAAADDVMVLHCLPAYRGKEISADVLDGPRSFIWDEAENRLHVQKALLAWLLETH
jgi:ornithine carbamoyltransferase